MGDGSGFTPEVLRALQATAPPSPGPTFTSAADVAVEPTYWLWQHYVPLRHLTIVAGVGGLGKGVLLATVGASVTRGTLPGDRSGRPGDVVYICAEDTQATMRGRFQAAGADLDRVHFLDRPASFDVAAADVLAAAIAQRGWDLAMLAVDPLDAHLWGRDTHRKSDVQDALGRLVEAVVAVHPDAAVIGVAHLTKSESRAAVNRIMGTVGFSTAARSALILAPHPQAEDDRLLMWVKGNLLEIPPSTLPAVRFAIQGVQVGERPDGRPITAPRAEFLGYEDGHDPDDLVTPPSAEDRSAIGDAVDFLRDALAAGPVLANEMRARAKADGISARTLERAKVKLGIPSNRRGFDGGNWYWALPYSQPPSEGGDE